MVVLAGQVVARLVQEAVVQVVLMDPADLADPRLAAPMTPEGALVVVGQVAAARGRGASAAMLPQALLGVLGVTTLLAWEHLLVRLQG